MKTQLMNFLKIMPIFALTAIAFSPQILARSLSSDRTNIDFEPPTPSSVTSSEELENSARTENIEIELDRSPLNPTSELDRDSHFANFFNYDGQSEADKRAGLSGGSR
jgi:hypothetical protein